MNGLQRLIDMTNAATDSDPTKLKSLLDEFDKDTLEKVRLSALEEARAEAFAYKLLGETEEGQQVIQKLRNLDLSNPLSTDAVQDTFAGTQYYHLNERMNTGFNSYAGAGRQVEEVYRAVGGDFDDLLVRSNIVGNATMLRKCRLCRIF